MDHPDLKAYDRTSLRSLTHIGASAPLPLRLRAQKQFGPIVAHLYGASEMGVVSVLAPSEHDLSRLDRLASAGRVKAGVEVRFRGANGALVENGEVGTIEVRSAAMASGYRNNPDLTAQSFVEGWYRSGDLGRLDGEGCLHILGRAVDAWEVDGVLVMPTDIEAALCSLPAVRYASVARDVEANTMIAVVVAWPGMAVDGRECLRAVTAGFGEGVAASMVVIPVDRVPLTEQGKPDRAAIAELARSRLAA